ncbi:linear gramicidin synthase subunit B [Ruminiclostridium hungatei]|uniref:Linear gramicidin synthase subunit B n=1 Tax=Ruminiclostridium hungatei TaxID=48256 RepID=A0A1V4SGD9_RUMHU|nr:condensation domain-containing protein [Ruminiclostridium hungatei]OPX42337.1 linear gramicidin synthase subunit B [Ruminiclostridium hungatei]
MSITVFLAELQKMDIRLWLEEGRLRYSAPEGALTEEVRKEILARRQDIIDFLQAVRHSERTRENSLMPEPRPEKIPLSYAQKWLWLYSQKESSSFAYNIPAALRLKGQLKVAALKASIDEIVRRHEVLRTTFHMDDNELYQVILPELEIHLPVTDLKHLEASQREEKVNEYLNMETRLPFSLEAGPLLRAALLVLAEDEYALLITLHHIVSDNWSLNVFMGELAELYKSYCTGVPAGLPAPDIQYADYAIWQKTSLSGDSLKEHLIYWKERLKNIAAVPALPTDFMRAGVQTHNSIRQYMLLSPRLTQKLKEMSRSRNCTLYITVLSAFQVLLQQYTGFKDILVGTPVAGRTHKELEKLIGVFINTVVLWNSPEQQESFVELLQKVKKTTGEAFAHQEVPLEMLAEELQDPQNPQGQSRRPLFQVLFNMFSASFELELPGLKMTPFSLEVIGAQNLNSKFDIALLVIEHREGLQVDFSFNADVFAESTAIWLMKHFNALLEAIAENPDGLLCRLPELKPLEHLKIRPDNPFTPFERAEIDQTLIERFEQQVSKWPRQVALQSGTRSLSYSELNQLANGIGRMLLEKHDQGPGLSKEEKLRYGRQIILDGWGIEAQEKLKEVTVFAAGAGGSGSPTIMQLALLGVGNIIICDFDKVELSNLNRQALHDESRLGMNKAESAALTVRRMNPNVNVTARAEKLTRENIAELAGGASIIFDNLDDLEAKFVVSEYAVTRGIPHVISSMIERSSYSAVLHSPYTPCFHCLYDSGRLETVRQLRREKSGWDKVPNPVASPALFLSTGFACNEALKIILGLENVAYNKYFFFNQQASERLPATNGFKIVTYPFSEHFKELCKKQGFDWEKGFSGRFVEEITIEKNPACPMCGSRAEDVPGRLQGIPASTGFQAGREGSVDRLRSASPGQQTVALLLEHDVEMVAGILGVLKSGNIFVTMDSSYPEERLAYILEDTGSRIILTDDANQALAYSVRDKVSPGIRVLNMKELQHAGSSENLPVMGRPEALAYIMYTSGSSGHPKGVMQSNRNVLHYIMNYTNGTQISRQDRLSLIPSFSFSAAMMDTFAALLNGAALCLFNFREKGPAELGKWLVNEAISVYHSVPTVFRQLMAAVTADMSFPALRLIDFGGEAVSSADVQLYKKYCPDSCILVNGLGATELNVIRQYCINKETDISGKLVPVGYPVADTEIMLVDEDGREVGYNCPGEIVIKSEFLSPGYWGLEEQTGLVFRTDPEDSTRRLYYTGDMGRLRTDGCLEHLGRKDLQVKIRGIRIEPAEIETALLEVAAVRETAVVAEDNIHGDRQLVAYMVEDSQTGLELRELLDHLNERLPGYMVPSAFVKVEAFPLTLTGKVDRRRLTQQNSGLKQTGKASTLTASQPHSGTEAGRNTRTEELLCNIWKKVLKLEQVDVNDDFFQIGGDSLSGLRMIDLAHQEGLKLNPSQLSQCRTISKLACTISEKAQAVSEQTADAHRQQPAGERMETNTLPAAPQDETEELLWVIWQKVLKLEQVNVHDDFFQIGGDSLSGLRMIDLAHQQGLRLTPTQLSQSRTISRLAQVLRSAGDKNTAVNTGSRSEETSAPDGRIPVTSSQAWYLSTASQRNEPERFNLFTLLEVDHSFKPLLLREAVVCIMDSHQALRARFAEEDGCWRQYIVEVSEDVPFETFDLTGLPENEQKLAIEDACHQLQDSFDLTNGPLFGVAHFTLGAEIPERLFIVMHHIVGDNYSFGIILRELQNYYFQLVQTGHVEPRKEITAFPEFAGNLFAYCRSPRLEAEVDYWMGLPWEKVAKLKTDFPQYEGKNSEGSNRKFTVCLSEAETKKLVSHIPKLYQTTPEKLLIICLAETIGQWLDKDWIYIEAVDLGRTSNLFSENMDLSHTVGWISSARSLVLQRPDEETAPVYNRIRYLDEQINKIPGQGTGYTFLARLGDEGNSAVRRLQSEYQERQLFFNYLGQEENEPAGIRIAKENPGLRNHPDELRTFLLECICFIKEDRLYQQWNYSCNIHRQSTIEFIADKYMTYLKNVIEQAETFK